MFVFRFNLMISLALRFLHERPIIENFTKYTQPIVQDKAHVTRK